MSQRDQPGSGQRPGNSGRGGSGSSGRYNDFDDDLDLPVWGDSTGASRPSTRSGRAAQPPATAQPNLDEPPRRSRRAENMPTLGDALSRRENRQRRDAFPDEPDQTYGVDDARDRLRTRAARQRQPVHLDDDDLDEWSSAADAVGRRGRYPSDAPPRRQNARPARQFKAPNMGVAVDFANQFERPVVVVAGVGVVSLVLMVATIAARHGQLADWFPIHLNAAGSPDKWGSPSTLWRLPLMSVMVSLMAVVLAWFLAKRDAFAAQFILASTLLIQALCWIALIRLAW